VTKTRLSTVLILTLLATAFALFPARAPPPIPMTVYGYVFIEKATGEIVTAPAGMNVYAKWNTTVVANTTTEEDGYYVVGISGPPEGTLIDMWVETFNVTRITLQYYEILELNLTVPEAVGVPTADFYATPTSGSEPLTVQFFDKSTNFDNITSWEWDFDNDGVIDSTEQNPVYTYTQNGTYTVTLTVTGDLGTDTETKVDCLSRSASTPTTHHTTA